MVIGLGVGVLFGLTNGILVERVGLNPLIVTLGTWWIGAGMALGLSNGSNAFGFPQIFNDLGQVSFLGLPISDWYAVPVFIIGALLLSYTRFGSHVFATGGNRDAARLNGVQVRHIGIGLFVASALASAIAGVVFAARLDSATINPFTGLALQVIAACVIGGFQLVRRAWDSRRSALGPVTVELDQRLHDISWSVNVLATDYHRWRPVGGGLCRRNRREAKWPDPTMASFGASPRRCCQVTTNSKGAE